MFKYICLNLAILLIFTAGCEEEKYSIEMVPYEEGIERTFIFSGLSSDDEREKLCERLSTLYEEQIDPNTFTFWGTFNEYLPNDIGGAGFYTTFATDMGTTFIYSERFRGNDDLNYTIEEMQLLCDRYVDFLMGWLEYELGADPDFYRLWIFCDDTLRQDAKNLMIYFWLSNILQEYKSDAAEEMVMRMKHYVVERGYLGPREIHFFTENYEGDQEQMLPVIRRFVSEQMGYSYGQMAVDRLESLSDGERAEESMRQYILTTDFFQEAWEAKKREENNPYADPPDLSVEDYVLQDANIPFDMFPSTPYLEVKLMCKNEPFATNGEWDEESKQVVWSGHIAGKGHLPTFCHAAWSVPDEIFQEEHFGCVILRDELLSEYCIWRESLDEVEAEEWDSFISSLQPSEDLEEQLSSFHFWDYQPNAEEGAAQPVDSAEKGRNLILDILNNDEE